MNAVNTDVSINRRVITRQVRFNIFGLIVTLLIAAMMLGFGIPSFTQFLDNDRMAAAANDIITSIRAARSEAVKRHATVTVCASSNWNTANPDCNLGGGGGWIVFLDANSDLSVDASDSVILAHAPVADGITFAIDAGSLPYLQYGGDGSPRTAAAGMPISNFRLCDDRGDADIGGGIAAGRWIEIGVTGRPQVYHMRSEVQGNPIGGCTR